MLLWNGLIPELFNGPIITFWQALGLFLLTKLVFGGVGRRGEPPWKSKWREKMNAMPPEERERIKKRFMCKWGGKESSTPDIGNPTPKE
ncbi:MAG: hypothetical protein WD555_03110 [Fulvivirga sp.]